MARISTYQVDTNVTGADIWIGTDGNDNKKTKNFSPNILAQYLNENEVISTANSLRYRYDTIASGDSRKPGTISFQTEIGANVPFSSLTTFILSNKTLGSTTVDAFLNILPNTRILIQNSSNINFFGIYFVNSVTPHLTETGYYVVSLTYVSGNGNLSEDMDYLIHLIEYKTIVAPTPTLQSVTSAGNTTTTTVHLDGGALSDSINEQALFEPDFISTVNKNSGSGSQLDSLGQVSMTKDGISSGVFAAEYVTTDVTLQFPNKPTGTYTIATTADIPTTPLVALPFTTDHLTATNNQYVIGNLVWYLGNVYRCIANNDSIIPTSTLYWTNLGIGYPLVERPIDWNSTSGNNQILNKPTIPAAVTKTSDLTNDGEDGVNPFITLADVPVPTNGLPAGGTAGQILTKVDATDYNATWQENYADWTSQVKHIVKNNGLSGTITKGTAVYVTSSSGTNMLVGRASNTSEATSSKTMGLMQSDITTTGPNQTGFVITEGLLSGLNTAGQTAGDPVWLGVNGALIYGLINKPYAPAHLVFIGIVTKISAGNGEIFVKVQNGFELKELHDVDLITTTPINGHLLGYNGTLWVNKTVAGWLGYTPANKAGDTFTGNVDAPSMSLNGVNLESLMIAYAIALG
jgi:hypothetical protein